jgi:hypothetical protein
MLPSNKNNTSPCTPVSSNCVIWQGPDIACIDLCTGDTVSDVVAKLAEEVCSIIDASCQCTPDLTGLDISCITAVPPTDLVATLQEIINYACNLTPEVDASKVILPLAKCFQYREGGKLIEELPADEWAKYVGDELCSLFDVIKTLNQNQRNLESQVRELQACVLPCEGKQKADFNIISTCLFKGSEVQISELVLAIETELCAHNAAVGTISSISRAISAQPVSGSSPRLSVDGTIGNIAGWNNAPATLAETINNQWLAFGDIYTAVSEIQESLPKNCENVDFKFTYNTVDSSGNGVPDFINLNFQATRIPSGFSDCNGFTTVTVTDSNGTQITQNINVSGSIRSTSGVNVDITSLNRFSSLNLSIPFCVTDGNSQCADGQQVIIPLDAPCPSVTLTQSLGTITATFPNTLGNRVSYKLEAISQTTGIILGTTTINNPSTSVNYVFNGTTPGETYDVIVSVIAGEAAITTCPAVSITVAGVICNDLEITTPSTAVVELGDVFLGLYDSGVTVDRYWYDADSGLIKTENVGVTVPCDSPILTSPVMDYLGTPGDVAVDVSYGTEPSPTDFEISWSVDNILYSGATPYAGAPVNPVVIATGQTNGSVYIKVETTCTGPLTSVPTIIRYDFATALWTTMQSPQECADTSLVSACPAGIEVARQFLDCGSSTYTVFGGSADSYWFYVGKRVNSLGVTTYIYAGWDNATNSVRSIVECCTCPTFILSDPIQILCGIDGDSVNITLPYVLGSGEPEMSVILNPVLGTVVQGAIANEFVYTSINPSGAKDYADTFQVQLQPSVPGTGNCTLDVFTVQVELISRNVKLDYTDQDIYVFVNTNGISSANGTQLLAGFGELETYWNAEFGYTGNIYFIPTSSKEWVGYAKAIVDNGNSFVQSPDLAWQALENLPTSWSAGVGTYKNSGLVLIFSNDSSAVYHDTILTAGYGSGLTAQPTVAYKNNYDELLDIINGTQVSLWAQSLGITTPQFPDGLGYVLYPQVVNASGGIDAANILQMISGYTAELIPVSKYGIRTAPDVTPYILQGIASSMPYSGAFTPTNPITQLFNSGLFGTLALLDQEDSIQGWLDINDGIGQFRELITRALKGPSNAYPVSTIPTTDVYEVQDCAGVWPPWFVRITDHGCGTIGEGTVVKLTNPGATFPAGGGRPEWATLTNKCVTIVDNCSATPDELTVDLDSTYDVCASCTP